MQGDTALHIALRKSSLDVAEVIRSSEGAEELRNIANKVCCTTSCVVSVLTTDRVLLQAEKTPDTITPEQSEYVGHARERYC